MSEPNITEIVRDKYAQGRPAGDERRGRMLQHRVVPERL